MLMLFEMTSQLLFGADEWIGFLIVAAVLLARALQLKFTTGLGETFVLSAAVGTDVQQKTMTQVAQ
jgi:hypothetical protein